MYKILLKPIFDFLIASIIFLLLLPIFIITLLFLLVISLRNPFFLQKRPGKNENIFSIIKFKTMNDKKDLDGNLLSEELRLTRTGKFLRLISLDEIPQLINVIKGDMSLVGPRPLLRKYIALYNDFQKQRHNVKPGITGYAQVNGRNAISWEEKFDLDVYYVQNVTFALDLKIVFKTVKKVFLRVDIDATDTTTTEHFKGSEN